ncbi:hypothetical protein [Nitrincola sp. A-D6]|uniref:hypothetical protein n=1 Tax=Nitrincola sp. A-D6 TaxID=1545442 RepID=UPI00190FAA54|nr:hypothetical protein [Nitrincola sp. A-D6]
MKKLFLLCVLLFISTLASAEKLVVGITLHPYYSYVSKVAGDRAEVLPLIAGGFNPTAMSCNRQI